MDGRLESSNCNGVGIGLGIRTVLLLWKFCRECVVHNDNFFLGLVGGFGLCIGGCLESIFSFCFCGSVYFVMDCRKIERFLLSFSL